MEYICLKKQHFSLDAYHLVPFREEDLFLIKEWRNAKIDLLRQKTPLTDESQQQYWKEALLPAFSKKAPSNILFSYLKKDTLIGYGGLTHIDWENRHAEVSFLLNPDFLEETVAYREAFSNYLTLLKEVAFSELSLHRLYTETYDLRKHHVEVLEEVSFLFEGRMHDHVFIQGRYVDSLIHGLVDR